MIAILIMELAGFIVGLERSGTTVTSVFLSQHPEAYVINDPHYLNFFAESLIKFYGPEVGANQTLLEQINSPNASLLLSGLLNSTLEAVKSWYKRWKEFKDDPVDLDAFYLHTIYCVVLISLNKQIFSQVSFVTCS